MSWFDDLQESLSDSADDIGNALGTVFDYRLEEEVEEAVSSNEAIYNQQTSIAGGSGGTGKTGLNSSSINWQIVGVGIAAVGLLFTVLRR